jgi:hypothetical protein
MKFGSKPDKLAAIAHVVAATVGTGVGAHFDDGD